MDASRPQRVATVRGFCAQHARGVLFDEPSAALMDTASGRALSLDAANLQTVEERRNRETGEPYLLLVYEDGRQLALSDAGIGFAPDFRNAGATAELPPVVSWRDFRTLLDRLKHELYGHPDQPPARSTLELLLMCIAVLDGARAAGFEVGREEREVEVHLKELERRAPNKP